MRMFGTAWYNRALFKILITGCILNGIVFVLNTSEPANAEPAKEVYSTLERSLKPDGGYGKASEVKYIQQPVHKKAPKAAVKVISTKHYTIADLEKVTPNVPAHKPTVKAAVR